MATAAAAGIDDLDWAAIEAMIAARGMARTGPVLGAADCAALVGMYGCDSRFRSRIDMARYGFGQGEYSYFAYPLPAPVAGLRRALYARLAPIANRMMAALGDRACYPASLDAYLARCHAAGQRRPTPLLLRYGAGDWNNLHRDLYGDLLFPLQATIMLSRPGADYDGGAFLLVENRPRRQARGVAVTPGRGEMLIFPTHSRPVAGKRAMLRATLRHGTSPVERGHRHALGLIFHDAA